MAPEGGATVEGPEYDRRPVPDYAATWTAERGRCHRFVYGSEDGHPTHCPEPTVTSRWRHDGQGRWYAVDACAVHSEQLARRAQPISQAASCRA